MPIHTGSRLERLERLQRSTRHARDSAQRRGDNHEAGRLDDLERKVSLALAEERARQQTAVLAETRRPRAENVLGRLAELGVTSNDVKVWAVSAGLITEVRRGRIAAALVEAWAAAHPTDNDTRSFPLS